MCVTVNDDQIIELFWQRNESAIDEMDAAYGRRLHSLSDHILDNYEDAQECVSDTYLRTWNSIPPKRPQFFFGYIATICRRLSLNRLDWRMAEKRNAEIVSLTQEMELCIPDKMMEAKLNGRELGKILNEFLGTLSQESRVIFLRRYWYADTVSEIAQCYGFSESKVKMQLRRTRDKLAGYLAKEGIAV